MSELKPYYVECKKHGNGWYALDECPKCMEEEYYLDLGRSDLADSTCEICGGKVEYTNYGYLQYLITEREGTSETEWEEVRTHEHFCKNCYGKIQTFIQTLKPTEGR